MAMVVESELSELVNLLTLKKVDESKNANATLKRATNKSLRDKRYCKRK